MAEKSNEKRPDRKSKIHSQVLEGLKELHFDDEYELHTEKKGGRLDLPNASFGSHKPNGQRKLSLCFPDAVLCRQGKLRTLIEVVDSNPGSPNGIVGLIVNADRIARLQKNIRLDLLIIVLSEMKRFHCKSCSRGHKFSKKEKCVSESLRRGANDSSQLSSLLHAGVPMNYRKALVDYDIGPYLTALPRPMVVFLNSTKIKDDWPAYEPTAQRIIQAALQKQLSYNERTSPSEVVLSNIDELFPEHVRSEWDGLMPAGR